MNTRSRGDAGESLAVTYLESLGWQILGRNVHKRFGEIDILADNKTEVILVEVKAKKNSVYGSAVEMLTLSKQATLSKLAKLVQAQYNKPVRIDVITIDGFATSEPKLTHYPYAVGEV